MPSNMFDRVCLRFGNPSPGVDWTVQSAGLFLNKNKCLTIQDGCTEQRKEGTSVKFTDYF